MSVDSLERDGKPSLSYVAHIHDDDRPVVIFVHGFKSDKGGTKAVYLEDQCLQEQMSYIRFDCAAHGDSKGVFAECSISSWTNDLLDIIDHLCGDRQVILIGSSMGGWLSLLAAREKPDKVAGMIGIAAAPDFTDEIFYDRLGQRQRDVIMSEGKIDIPSGYEDSLYTISKLLIEDGRKNFLLDQEQPIFCPIRLLQGKKDEDVPWEKAIRIEKCVASNDVKVVLIEDGDHRLSRDSDLDLLMRTLREIYSVVSA